MALLILFSLLFAAAAAAELPSTRISFGESLDVVGDHLLVIGDENNTVEVRLNHSLDCSGGNAMVVSVWLNGTFENATGEVLIGNDFVGMTSVAGHENGTLVETWFEDIELPFLSSEDLFVWGLRFNVSGFTGTMGVKDISCVGNGVFGDINFGKAEVLKVKRHTILENPAIWSPWIQAEHLIEPEDFKSTVTSFPENGTMKIDYVATRTVVWGGNVQVEYTYPDHAFVNWSDATHISFQYRNLRPQSVPGMAHFRLIIGDMTNCSINMQCIDKQHQEVFFSFLHILSDDSNEWKEISLPLVGNKSATAPFIFTGWIGTENDGVLNPGAIKTVALEISVGSNIGEIGYETSGSVLLANFSVTRKLESDSRCDRGASTFDGIVFLNPDKFIEFGAGICCESCAADSDCIFFQTNERDCMLFTTPPQESQVMLRKSKHNKLIAFENPLKKSVCDQCVCQDTVVDCSNANLREMPLIDVPGVTVLNLQSNPQLSILGPPQPSLNNLQYLNIRNTSIFALDNQWQTLQNLIRVDADFTTSSNLAREGHIKFNDVCCNIARANFVNEEGDTWYWCTHVSDWSPCADCFLDEYVTYHDESTPLDEITPDSIFAYATQSPENCGELCSRTDSCLYFTLDRRHTNSYPTCYLRTDDNIQPFFQNDTGSWVHSDTPSPGFVSGGTATARAIYHNASISLDPASTKIVDASSGRGTGTIAFRVGARPVRGAVWITPVVKVIQLGGNDQNQFDSSKVTVSPPIIVVYEGNYDQDHEVQIIVEAGTAWGKAILQISNEVHACDTAFVSEANEDLSIELDVFLLTPTIVDTNSTMISSFVTVATIATMTFGLIMFKQNKDNQRRIGKKSMGLQRDVISIEKEREMDHKFYRAFQFVLIGAEVYDMISDLSSLAILTTSEEDNPTLVIIYSVFVAITLGFTMDIVNMRVKVLREWNLSKEGFHNDISSEVITKMSFKQQANVDETLATLADQYATVLSTIQLKQKSLRLAFVQDVPSVCINGYLVLNYSSPTIPLVSFTTSLLVLGYKLSYATSLHEYFNEKRRIERLLAPKSQNELSEFNQQVLRPRISVGKVVPLETPI